MPASSNQAVQNFSDQYLRTWCETARSLVAQSQAIIGNIGGVYANLTASNPSSTWVDGRTDSPPNLLQVSDLLAINAAINAFVTSTTSSGNDWSVVQAACVRPLQIPD